MHTLLPSTDTHIARKYGIGTIELKMQNKTSLQSELGWPKEPKRPVICFPAGMTDALGGNLLKDLLPGLLNLQSEILVLGKGSASYGTLFTKLTKEQSHRMHIVSDKEENIHKMYAAADMAIFLHNPAGSKELKYCLEFGVVPLAPTGTTLLDDYNPLQETGNAFLYDSADKWLIFASLVRAMETHKFPYDWRTIQRHCMESVMK